MSLLEQNYLCHQSPIMYSARQINTFFFATCQPTYVISLFTHLPLRPCSHFHHSYLLSNLLNLLIVGLSIPQTILFVVACAELLVCSHHLLQVISVSRSISSFCTWLSFSGYILLHFCGKQYTTYSARSDIICVFHTDAMALDTTSAKF